MATLLTPGYLGRTKSNITFICPRPMMSSDFFLLTKADGSQWKRYVYLNGTVAYMEGLDFVDQTQNNDLWRATTYVSGNTFYVFSTKKRGGWLWSGGEWVWVACAEAPTLRKYTVSGSTATLDHDPWTFGDTSCVAQYMIHLDNGLLLLVWYDLDSTERADTGDHRCLLGIATFNMTTEEIIAYSGDAINIPVYDASVSGEVNIVAVQHPVDNSIWIFNLEDSDWASGGSGGWLGATHLQEDLTLISFDIDFISVAVDGINGRHGEFPGMAVTSDSTYIYLTYQNHQDIVNPGGGYGGKVSICRVDSSGNKTFCNYDNYVERVAELGLTIYGGKYYLMYRGYDVADYSPEEIYVVISNDFSTWGTPVNICTLDYAGDGIICDVYGFNPIYPEYFYSLGGNIYKEDFISPFTVGVDSDDFTDADGTDLADHETDNGVSWVQETSTGFDGDITIQSNRLVGTQGEEAVYYYDALSISAPYKWTVWFRTPAVLNVQASDEFTIALAYHDVVSNGDYHGYKIGLKGHSTGDGTVILETWRQYGAEGGGGNSSAFSLSADTLYRLYVNVYTVGAIHVAYAYLYTMADVLIMSYPIVFDQSWPTGKIGKTGFYMLQAGATCQFQVDSMTFEWNPSAICWGNSSTAESPMTWKTWEVSDGVAGTVLGNPNWGVLELQAGYQYRGPVGDTGDSSSKTFTLTPNVYDTGIGTPAVYIRGDVTAFAQHDSTPAWTKYITPVSQAWRYVQVMIISGENIPIESDSASITLTATTGTVTQI